MRNRINVGDPVVFIDDYNVSNTHTHYTFSNLKNQTGIVVSLDGEQVDWRLDSNGEQWNSDLDQLIHAKNHIVTQLLKDL